MPDKVKLKDRHSRIKHAPCECGKNRFRTKSRDEDDKTDKKEVTCRACGLDRDITEG